MDQEGPTVWVSVIYVTARPLYIDFVCQNYFKLLQITDLPTAGT